MLLLFNRMNIRSKIYSKLLDKITADGGRQMPQLFEPAPEAHGSKKRNCPNLRNSKLKNNLFFLAENQFKYSQNTCNKYSFTFLNT